MAQNENELLQQIGTDLGVDETDSKNPVRQVREALERRDKQIQKLQKDLEDAPKAAEDRVRTQLERQGAATEIGTKLGYPKAVSLFLEKHPEGDITEEGFRSFLTDTVGVEVKPPEGEQKAEGESQAQGNKTYTPEQVGKGNVAAMHQVGGAPTGQKRYTGAEALAAYNRGEISVEDFTRALDDGSISKGDPGYVVHKQPG